MPSGHRAAILAWFSRRTEVEAGDIVFTYGYPLGFGQASFGDFAVTRHVVAGVDGGDLLDAGGNRFRFTHDSDVEFYMERTPGFAEPTIIDSWIVDHMSPEVPDSILINTGSPSAPQASVNLQQSGSGNDAFVDVQTGLFQ